MEIAIAHHVLGSITTAQHAVQAPVTCLCKAKSEKAKLNANFQSEFNSTAKIPINTARARSNDHHNSAADGGTKILRLLTI